MKKLWTGEEVHHEGRYFTGHGTHMGLTPYQKPHPPLWIAAHSHGAAARAGRLGDGLVVGPQVSHHDLTALVQTFRQEWHRRHAKSPTRMGAWRPILIGADPTDALERGRKSGLTHVTCQFHNLPEDLSARLEYLEGFGAEVIQKLTG